MLPINNCKKSSKSRILIEIINNYQKPQSEAMNLEKAKLKSIQQIELRFAKSETNKNYRFPLIEENETEEQKQSIEKQHSQKLDIPTKPKVFKDLMNKIYQINTTKTKQYQQSDFIKKQYSIQTEVQRSIVTANKNNSKINITDKKKEQIQNLSSFKKSSTQQSRGQSPIDKNVLSNRSIGSQIVKLIKAKQNLKISEVQLQTSHRSFEAKQLQLNKSQSKLQQNKSFDQLKNFYQLKAKK